MPVSWYLCFSVSWFISLPFDGLIYLPSQWQAEEQEAKWLTEFYFFLNSSRLLRLFSFFLRTLILYFCDHNFSSGSFSYTPLCFLYLCYCLCVFTLFTFYSKSFVLTLLLYISGSFISPDFFTFGLSSLNFFRIVCSWSFSF